MVVLRDDDEGGKDQGHKLKVISSSFSIQELTDLPGEVPSTLQVAPSSGELLSEAEVLAAAAEALPPSDLEQKGGVLAAAAEALPPSDLEQKGGVLAAAAEALPPSDLEQKGGATSSSAPLPLSRTESFSPSSSLVSLPPSSLRTAAQAAYPSRLASPPRYSTQPPRPTNLDPCSMSEAPPVPAPLGRSSLLPGHHAHWAPLSSASALPEVSEDGSPLAPWPDGSHLPPWPERSAERVRRMTPKGKQERTMTFDSVLSERSVAEGPRCFRCGADHPDSVCRDLHDFLQKQKIPKYRKLPEVEVTFKVLSLSDLDSRTGTFLADFILNLDWVDTALKRDTHFTEDYQTQKLQLFPAFESHVFSPEA
ncbi:unnamed protein product [Polarella glacialis]|uniref:Uncharacterized protein n=1 Tax=Polarella glacialis TaxID=89957 RepID=A0A813JKR4_POLGL|nr:unnamed protein product [Polarella glacialis]